MKWGRYMVVLALLMLGCMSGKAQMQFFQGTFEEALKQAQTEHKNVFIDFYTVWCGPCKMMSAQVFPDAEVAAYFNEKFVNYQINAEDKNFAEEVKRFRIQAYPTLVFLDPSGKLLAQQAGAMDAASFLRLAKRVNGELMSFEKMYDQLKTRKSDQALIQALLLEAPDYLAKTPEGPNYDRWELRINRLYNDYRKKKAVKDMMNPADFNILMIYHPEADKNDEILNYIVGNYDEVVKSAGKNAVDRYVFVMNTDLIQRLAEKGDLDYLRQLDRLKGDMKPVYDSLMNFNGKDAYTGMKCLYDAKYNLYSRKDADKFISLMDQYFEMLGETVKPEDYRLAVDDFSNVFNGKFSPAVTAKCLDWVTKALQGDMDPGSRMEMLLMLGDCHKMQKNIEAAKKCYNQAYMLSLQFGNPGLSAAVQRYSTDLEE